MGLEVLYLDDDVVAVHKPSGLFVHRSGLSAERVSVMSLLRQQLGRWVYPVHRLDRATSGVLLFGLNAAAAAGLAEQFAARTTQKTYLAMVRGFIAEEGRIERALKVDERELDALTFYRRLATAEVNAAVGRHQTARYSLVAACPETGRRHQLRRHFNALAHPIVGDTVYGDGRHNRFVREHFGVYRLMLFAYRLAFSHPRTGRPMQVTAALDTETASIFADLGWAAVTL